MEFYPFGAPHSKWSFLSLSTEDQDSKKTRTGKRQKDKHLTQDRKYFEGWNQINTLC